VYDLRADGPEQQALKWIQSSATDDDQVSALRRFDDDVAGVALRLDRLAIDPARGQQLLCLVEIVASLRDLRWIEVGSLCDASARQRLGGRDHDHTSGIAGKRGGALKSPLCGIGSSYPTTIFIFDSSRFWAKVRSVTRLPTTRRSSLPCASRVEVVTTSMVQSCRTTDHGYRCVSRHRSRTQGAMSPRRMAYRVSSTRSRIPSFSSMLAR
jgi:hypothetical protein